MSLPPIAEWLWPKGVIVRSCPLEENHFQCSVGKCKASNSGEDGRGLRLIADRDLEPGQVVCVSPMYVALPIVDALGSRCDFCLQKPETTTTLPTCKGCRNAAFCDRKCQTRAWESFHRLECKTMAAVRTQHPLLGEKMHATSPEDLQEIRTAFRVICRATQQKKADKSHNGVSFGPVPIQHVENLWWKRRSSRYRPHHAQSGDVILEKLIGIMPESEIAQSALLRFASNHDCLQDRRNIESDAWTPSPSGCLLEKMRTNNFLVHDSLLMGVASGVSPAGAVLNHSCLPNACFSYYYGKERKQMGQDCINELAHLFSDVRIQHESKLVYDAIATWNAQVFQVARTTRHVVKGEEICHSYVDQAATTLFRRERLQHIYDFVCRCVKCTGTFASPRFCPSVSALHPPSALHREFDSLLQPFGSHDELDDEMPLKDAAKRAQELQEASILLYESARQKSDEKELKMLQRCCQLRKRWMGDLALEMLEARCKLLSVAIVTHQWELAARTCAEICLTYNAIYMCGDFETDEKRKLDGCFAAHPLVGVQWFTLSDLLLQVGAPVSVFMDYAKGSVELTANIATSNAYRHLSVCLGIDHPLCVTLRDRRR